MIDSQRYKELYNHFQHETDEKLKIDLMVEMGSEVRNFDVEEASKMADEIVHRSKVIAYTSGIAKALKLKGSCHWLKGEYEMGIETLQVGLNIAVKIKDKRLEARILYYLGNIYRDQGDFAKVLAHFKNALGIYVALGDEYALSIISTSIANLLYDLGDYDNALEYALKCLPIFTEANKINNLINLNNTLGNIYFKKDQFDEAMRYFRNNIEMSEPETLNSVTAESGLGKVYYKLRDFDSARRHLAEALRLAEHLGNIEVQIICQFYLGCMYLDKSAYRQALQYLNHAFTLATEYTRRQDLMIVNEVLANLYDKTNDIPKAFYHLKSYQTLKDEIFQKTILNELRNMQVQQQLELAQKEKDVAEKTAQLKHQFMANMSHEIRTPMNAVVGMTKLLLNRNHLPEQTRYLKAIEQSANNLLVIINDILDLSKIEAGKIVIEKVDFNVREVLQGIRDMLIFKAEEKNIDFKISTDGKIPDRLVGDPTRLNQVLINLAGNSVKFTKHGFVEIRTTLKARDNKLRIQFDVIDTGIGISPQYIDHIFDSFTQAGNDVTRKFGGTGLGLTISKQLTNMMGGDITVSSELNKGSVFSVILPFDEADGNSSKQQKAEVTEKMLEELGDIKILLAEDNEFNQLVAVETIKEKLPHVVIDIAVNGELAIEMCRNKNYDLVLMDVQMPVMDGVTATQRIRKDLPSPNNNVKIIAMTANVLQEDVHSYFESGMNEYVSKPFQIDDLLLKMHAILQEVFLREKARRNAAATAAAASRNIVGSTEPARPVEQPRLQTAPAPANINFEAPVKAEPVVPAAPQRPLPEYVTDRNFLKQFTGGNPEKMKKYITIFIDNAGKLMENLNQGLRTKDHGAIRIAAHTLKPQFSYMGISEEVSHIFLLEQMATNSADLEKIAIEIRDLERVCVKAFEELKKML